MRPRPKRRGVTLIEMLVVVALLVLIMTIIASVFQSATGAVRASQITHDMEQALRRLEGTLRQDLLGVTARLTPPLDPKDNLGHFAYGENARADAQQEDSDDWISFTVKAPVGQPFTGRYWDPNAPAGLPNPIIISSEFAEVLYFLRNGNLYRRVLLIVPERAGSQLSTLPLFNPTMLGGATCGWPGVNDISAHPDLNPRFGVGVILAPVPNTLGDLTNRQNRFAHPRFTPYQTRSSPAAADDLNTNGIPDYYPTLYPNAVGSQRASLLNEPAFTVTPNRDTRVAAANGRDILAFPFVFPGAYSNPAYPAYGQIRNLNPLNHSPLETGDSLGNPSTIAGGTTQTYWGWPTWKETASPRWDDPVHSVNSNFQQSVGLSWDTTAFRALPPMTTALLTVLNDPGSIPATFTSTSVPFRQAAQPFNDGTGSSHFTLQSAAPNDAFWRNAWEDDLIMSGVRSFDVKAYDSVANAYIDLGPLTPPSPLPQAFLTQNSFQHDGTMPPRTGDKRYDPQYFDKTGLQHDLGDDSPDTIRLVRVWDTWSTDYTNAPDTPYDPTAGPPGGKLPVYPSYPPPYPAPMRGIQIQVRIANQPDADRLRVLTIRHDFSDKL